jgi:type IV secretion system protein VirB6
MDIQVAQTLYDAVDASLKSLLTDGTANVMIGIGALMGTFWLLAFTMRSMQWLWTGMTAIYKDVLFEILKMAVITSMAFNVGWYIDTVVPFVTGLPVWMGGVMSGQEGNQLNQVDTLISTYVDGLDKLTSAMSFNFITSKASEIYLGLQAVVIYLVGGIPFILVAVGTMITLKVATTIMLAVGPVFIAFLLFEQTRQWFMGWVATVAGFMLTQVMFAIVLGLEVRFINTNVIKNGQIDTSLMGNISMLVYFLTFTVLATELPNYAASVMGGASSGGVTGLGGILGKATGLGTAGRLAKAGGKFAAKQLAKRFGNKLGAG